MFQPWSQAEEILITSNGIITSTHSKSRKKGNTVKV
jgi:hypothetical protein